MIGVCEDGKTACFVDRSHGVFKVHVFGDGLCHPQRQDVPIAAVDLNTRNNVEGILILVGVGPQARLHDIVICDGNGGQFGAMLGNVVQQITNRQHTIAGCCVHVEIGVPESRL
jgi:hypothetical protein